MIPAQQFCDQLLDAGYELFSGVPCSRLAGPIRLLEKSNRYHPASNEGAALAIAAGARAAGIPSAVLMQNSGIGNLVNPLMSLNLVYHIPVLILVSMRGWPDPATDEPQHALTGRTTTALLDSLDAPYWIVRQHDRALDGILHDTAATLAQGRSAFILLERGSVAPLDADTPVTGHPTLTRRECLAPLLSALGDVPIITTTGYTSRDMFAQADLDRIFYMQGSMGYASAFALGSALALGDQRVAILDGDGAAIMHLGTLSVIGHASPKGLLHIIFDNRGYESTGGQETPSSNTDLAAVALACGYASAVVCDTVTALTDSVRSALDRPGPHCIVVRISATPAAASPRPSGSHSLPELYLRYAASLHQRRHEIHSSTA